MCGSPFFSLRANFYEALGLLLKVLLMKCIKIHTLCFLQLIQYKCCCFLSTNINCFVVYVFLWSESLLHIEKLLSLSKARVCVLLEVALSIARDTSFIFWLGKHTPMLLELIQQFYNTGHTGGNILTVLLRNANSTDCLDFQHPWKVTLPLY